MTILAPVPPLMDLSTVDLTKIDPTWMISRHFSFREALYLPSWGRMAGPQDGLTLTVLARVGWFLREKMDVIRDDYGAICVVPRHVCWRPRGYNALVGGARNSSHMALVDASGMPLAPEAMVAAMDFEVVGFEGGAGCDKIRARLVPELPARGLRMENRPGSDWIHLDCAPVLPGHNHFFLP
jgi:hypothetical protein